MASSAEGGIAPPPTISSPSLFHRHRHFQFQEDRSAKNVHQCDDEDNRNDDERDSPSKSGKCRQRPDGDDGAVCGAVRGDRWKKHKTRRTALLSYAFVWSALVGALLLAWRSNDGLLDNAAHLLEGAYDEDEHSAVDATDPTQRDLHHSNEPLRQDIDHTAVHTSSAPPRVTYTYLEFNFNNSLPSDLSQLPHKISFSSNMGSRRSTESLLLSSSSRTISPNEKRFYEQCVPMTQWQTTFFPTCNSVHELSLTYDISQPDETTSKLLSAGGSWRMVFKISPQSSYILNQPVLPSIHLARNASNSIPGLENLDQNTTSFDVNDEHASVLKMLKLDRDFNEESYANHILDSVAMERLSKSPFVIDIYAFCGQSVLTEYANGDARSFIKNHKIAPRERLQIASNMARGLSDIHSIDYPGGGNNVTLSHNDINLSNIALVHHSSIKFNDFNIGVMMRWSPDENKPCGFPVLYNGTLWRSPEEIRNETYVSEKTDIYSFGNVLFQTLTKHQPWTWLEPGGQLSIGEVAKSKTEGKMPFIPTKYRNGKSVATMALYIATIWCLCPYAEKRPTAFQLHQALELILNEYDTLRMMKHKSILIKEQELHVIFTKFGMEDACRKYVEFVA